jgi:uncharacterized protein with HEPN domain
MRKDPNVYLSHIMHSIYAIENYLQGVSKEEFLNSEEKQDLISRRLEIIGEAVKQLPEDFKQDHEEVPWRDIGDMRNVLIHVYFDVDYTIVWKTATELVPQLKKQIENLL